MKFLCVECDEAMQLRRSEGPEEGSLTVTFGCPRCSRRVAMLTNLFETQLIRSLGVKVGGRDKPIVPFEHLRTSMAQQREPAFQGGDARPRAPEETSREAPLAAEQSGTPGCPFAAMVAGQEDHNPGAIGWSPEAEARVERIPSFIRPMAKKAIERYAEGKRYSLITEAVMEEARSALGM